MCNVYVYYMAAIFINMFFYFIFFFFHFLLWKKNIPISKQIQAQTMGESINEPRFFFEAKNMKIYLVNGINCNWALIDVLAVSGVFMSRKESCPCNHIIGSTFPPYPHSLVCFGFSTSFWMHNIFVQNVFFSFPILYKTTKNTKKNKKTKHCIGLSKTICSNWL